MDNQATVYKYRNLLPEHNYIKALCSSVISRFGDSIDAIAYSWLVYEITQAKEWSAVVFGVNMLTSVLISPIAGVITDKLPKKATIILCDMGRCLMVILTMTLLLLQLINPYVICGITFMMSTFEAFRNPAAIAIYPKIVPRDKYTIAQSFSSSMSRVSEVLGMGAAGVIIGLFGIHIAMVVDAITFFISMAIYSTIRIPKEKLDNFKMNFSIFLQTSKEGLKYILNKKIIALMCVLGAILNLLFVPINALLTPYVIENLDMGANAVSLVNIALVVGMGIGAYFFPRLSKRISKSKLFIVGGIIGTALYFSMSAITLITSPAVVYVLLCVCFFVSGAGFSMLTVTLSIVIIEQVDPDYLARMSGIFSSVSALFAPIMSFIIAIFAKFFDTIVIFIVFGVLCQIFFCYMFTNKLFRTINIRPEQETEANNCS